MKKLLLGLLFLATISHAEVLNINFGESISAKDGDVVIISKGNRQTIVSCGTNNSRTNESDTIKQSEIVGIGSSGCNANRMEEVVKKLTRQAGRRCIANNYSNYVFSGAEYESSDVSSSSLDDKCKVSVEIQCI